MKILDNLENVDIKRLKNTLSIASKAGLVCLGFDAAVAALKGVSCSLLLLSHELSENTKRAIIKVATDFSTTYRVLCVGLSEFESMVGKHVGIIAVIDQGLVRKVNEILRLRNTSPR